MKALLLVVEVLSPGTARQDRFTERRLYQESGVPLYWIVDLDQKAVEVWATEAQLPAIESECMVWNPKGAEEGFVPELAELFKPV